MSSGMWDKSPFNVTASLMEGQCCLYHKFIYMLLHFFILFLVSYCLFRVSVLGRWSPPFLDASDTVIFACGGVGHARHVHVCTLTPQCTCGAHDLRFCGKHLSAVSHLGVPPCKCDTSLKHLETLVENC